MGAVTASNRTARDVEYRPRYIVRMGDGRNPDIEVTFRPVHDCPGWGYRVFLQPRDHGRNGHTPASDWMKAGRRPSKTRALYYAEKHFTA